MVPGPADINDTTLVKPPDPERLCVVARAVMSGLPGLMDDGLTGSGLQQTATHAAVLADFETLQTMSTGAVTDRGFGLCDALTRLGTESALTHVAWVEDALGEF